MVKGYSLDGLLQPMTEILTNAVVLLFPLTGTMTWQVYGDQEKVIYQ